MRRAGLSVAVGNAVPEVKKAAHYSHSWLPEVHSINASDTVQLRTGVVLRIGNW